MSNTTAPISEASNDVAQCVMNLANHILPYTYQRPASSSSSPRADGDGRDGDDSYVHVVDDVKPRPDGSDGNASVVHALHSPPTPTADVVLEMPILAQPSPSRKLFRFLWIILAFTLFESERTGVWYFK